MNEKNNSKNSSIEEKILEELQKNCRQNLDEIGKKCGCSRHKVTRVMKKLEDKGIILGYTAIINPKKMNLNQYFLLFKRTSIPIGEEILKKLPVNNITDIIPIIPANIKNISTHYINGEFDWITSFIAEDISDAKDFCNQILKMFHKYVENLILLEVVLPIRMQGFKITQKLKITDL